MVMCAGGPPKPSTPIRPHSLRMVPGPTGALLGGLAFICPGLTVIIALAALFLAGHPPTVVLGAAAGAGAAVPAVALAAAVGLIPSSWKRAGRARTARLRWLAYVALGAASAALIGPYLVVVIALCGALEIVARRPGPAERTRGTPAVIAAKASLVGIGGLGALVWVAFKVGALSYGGGFVIVPLMQHSAVVTYHWMTGAQFLDAVALGQVTPGPVVRPLPS